MIDDGEHHKGSPVGWVAGVLLGRILGVRERRGNFRPNETIRTPASSFCEHDRKRL